jgi:hypothetical protein
MFLYQLKKLMVFGFFFLNIVCNAQPIFIDNPRDYLILDRFFKMTFFQEEYGYVLEGNKPISIGYFSSLDQAPITQDINYSENNFNNAIFVREAIPVWNKLCLNQKNFILKADSSNSEDSLSSLEVLFINIAKLREVVDNDIDLFRHVLGATFTTQSIIDRIVNSDQSLLEILNYNLTLMGIVLGFGRYNSVVGGRLETILALSFSKDHPPFTPQSQLIKNEGGHSLDVFTPEGYWPNFFEFAGGADDYFRVNVPRQQPNSGFKNLVEEVRAIDQLEEALPSALLERPKFVFGAFKGGVPNQQFFEQLEKTQKKIRALLEKQDFLETVLTKITGERPLVRVDKKLVAKASEPKNSINWSEILERAARRFGDEEKQSAFVRAFCNPTDSCRVPPKMIGGSKATLKGLKTARLNLKKADEQFERFARDNSLKMVARDGLYFKTTFAGEGKELKGEDHVRLGYVMEDLEGNVLYANCDMWVNLSETIPGFAHGVQGMRVKEKRTLFVHPAYGYGALTTLPPCSGLIIKVHLLDIEKKKSGTLPSLAPLDMNWVLDPRLEDNLKKSLEQQPYYAGFFYREMLDKMEGVDHATLIAELEKIVEQDKPKL